MRRAVPFIAGATVIVVVAVIAAVLLGGGSSKKLTAYFPRTVGLYNGSGVRILGVQVGHITAIRNEGTRVRVDMEYDGKYKLPADVAAAIIPPAIVSDRYIQLTPAYKGGPTLPDNAVIPESRTAVPLELDQIFGNLNQLNVALGPKGANKNGALSRLIDVSAANLQGNGKLMNTALKDFSDAIATLGDNRGDLFGTITNLQKFTTTLAQDDGGVRRLNDDLAKVSVQLNGERQDLAAAFRNLAVALGQVSSFVHDNKAMLTSDIKGLGNVTGAIVKEKRALTEVLDDAPLALQNLALAYDPLTQTLMTRDDSKSKPYTNPGDQAGLVCQILTTLGAPCPSGGLNLGSTSAQPGASGSPATPSSAEQSLASLMAVGQ